MSTEVAGEQLILAWSSSNLLGASGLGPVAVSPGWTVPPRRDNFAGLGEAARYLPDSATIPLGAVPPVCLEYRPGPSGPLLVAKTYSTTSPRAGQYQVHAIRAASGLSPWDLWALAYRDVLIEHELGEYPADLPSLSITPARRPRVVREPDDVTELGRLLQCLNEDRPYLIRATDQAHGDSAIRTLLAYLPIGLARDVAVSTFLPSATGWTAGIGLLVSPFSAEAADVDLDLDPEHPALRPGRGRLPVAGRAAPDRRGRAAGPADPLPRRPEIPARPGTFGPRHRRPAHPGQGSGHALLRRRAVEARPPRRARRCAAPVPQRRHRRGDLRPVPARRRPAAGRPGGHPGAHAGASGTPSGRGPLQSWLLQAIGPDQFAGYVLPALVARGTRGRGRHPQPGPGRAAGPRTRRRRSALVQLPGRPSHLGAGGRGRVRSLPSRPARAVRGFARSRAGHPRARRRVPRPAPARQGPARHGGRVDARALPGRRPRLAGRRPGALRSGAPRLGGEDPGRPPGGGRPSHPHHRVARDRRPAGHPGVRGRDARGAEEVVVGRP